jgi:hypothetical protein
VLLRDEAGALVLRRELSLTHTKGNIIMDRKSSTLIALLQNLITGIQKNQPKGSFSIGGTKYTTPQVVSIMQSIMDALVATQAAHGTLNDAVMASEALVAKNGPFLRDLKQSLQIQAGDSASVLASYGLTPRRPHGTTSPEVQVAAADKARATRAARHTMGPKQKAKITGATASAASPQSEASPSSSNGAAPQSATPLVTPGH